MAGASLSNVLRTFERKVDAIAASGGNTEQVAFVRTFVLVAKDIVRLPIVLPLPGSHEIEISGPKPAAMVAENDTPLRHQFQ
jgi:hypothetical protein